MPLFFFLSGLVYKDKNIGFKDFFCYKAKALMYPYYVLGVLIIMYHTAMDIFKSQLQLVNILKRLAALIYGNYIWDNNAQYIGVLWFLAALFCVEILFYFVLRKCKNDKTAILVIAIITIAGTALSYLINYSRQFTPYNSGFRLPYCFDIALCALPFYALGYFIKNNDYTRYEDSIHGLVLFAIGGILGVANRLMTGQGIDMLYLRIYNPILFYVSAGLCVIGLCFWAKSNETWILKYGKAICSIGKKSLLMMVIHLYLIGYVNKILDVLNMNNAFIAIILTLLLSYILSCIVEMWLPFLYKFPRNIKVQNTDK